MIEPRARLAVATVFGGVALGAATWFSVSRHPTASEIEVCRAVLVRNAEASVAMWRAYARGEQEPLASTSATAGDLFQACAPLYSVASCRNAWLHGNEGELSSRASRLAEACRDAYCPQLQPKPALCTRDATNLSELSFMWRELDDAILSHELAERAEPLHEARRRGGREIEAALAAYFDAGSPVAQQRRRHGGARASRRRHRHRRRRTLTGSARCRVRPG